MTKRVAWNKGKKDIYSEETIEKIRNSVNDYYFKHGTRKHLDSEKRKIGRSRIGKKHSVESKRKMSETKKIRRSLRFTIKKIQEKYPFFSKVEELRYNPENEIEIQVKCKFCGKWFTPTLDQLRYRIYALEKEQACNLYLYCSFECKKKCFLYHFHDNKKETNYTNQQYDSFRKFVLERDQHICQFCGESATEVHHEKPQKLEPFFALDPDYAWSVCKKCHYEKGHKDECSTGNLANKIC